MDQFPDAQKPDPDHQLQRDIYDEATEALRDMLPPPRTDTSAA